MKLYIKKTYWKKREKYEKESGTKNETKGLIIKYQIMNSKINIQFSIKDCHDGKQPCKNNKVKYTVKQLKT
jgi:sensor histidine kinase YesM